MNRGVVASLMALGAVVLVVGLAGHGSAEDGDQMLIGDFDTNGIDEYELGQPYQVDTATHQVEHQHSATPMGLFYRPNGLALFVMEDMNEELVKFELSERFELNTRTEVDRLDVAALFGHGAQDVAFGDNGRKIFLVDNPAGGNFMMQVNLSDAWNLSAVTGSHEVDPQLADPRGVRTNNNGSKLFVGDGADLDIHEYRLSDNWNISSFNLLNTKSTTGCVDGQLESIAFNENGSVLATTGDDANNNIRVQQLNLSTAFDTTSATQVACADISADTSYAAAIAFNNQQIPPPPPPPGPEPVDLAEGLANFVAGVGFRTPTSQFFFALGVLGITAVGTGAALKRMASSETKRYAVAGVTIMVGFFFTFLEFIDAWQYVLGLILGLFTIAGGPELARNTFEDIQAVGQERLGIGADGEPLVSAGDQRAPGRAGSQAGGADRQEVGAGSVETDHQEPVPGPGAEPEIRTVEVDEPVL